MTTARAELTLAHPHHPLGALGLDPDPLAHMAQTFADLADTETLEVHIDLLPMHRRHIAAHRRRVERGDREPTAKGGWAQHLGLTSGHLAAGLNGKPVPKAPRPAPTRKDAGTVATHLERGESRQVADKTGSTDPHFHLQVLIVATAADRRRARKIVSAAVAGFAPFNGRNHFRVVGLHVGPWFFGGGANAPWNRAGFDRRVRTGRFAPKRRAVVTVTEMAGLLKPPTVHCAAPNVARSGGAVPTAPAMPVYDPSRTDLLPVGWVRNSTERYPAGVPMDGTFFQAMFGRSRFGKTNLGLGQFLAVALAGRNGCFFMDPHSDAVKRAKPYLTEPGVIERVAEVDLTDPERATGLNLLDMNGRTVDDLGTVAKITINSFSSTLNWSAGSTNRAMTFITMVAYTLCELNLVLVGAGRPDIQACIFSMIPLFGDQEWRAAVVPHLSRRLREFWAVDFKAYGPADYAPVTQLVHQLGQDRNLAACFGQSQSTYRVRQLMDAGAIVLVRTGGDKLVSNFLAFDLFAALTSRGDMAPADRLPFWCWLDEFQKLDGAVSETLTEIFEETAKFGGRLSVMAQQPARLKPLTYGAIMTNLSHLLVTNLARDDAEKVARQWGSKSSPFEPQIITRLPRYGFVGSVTLDGQPSAPCRITPFDLEEMWGDHCHPERVGDLDRAIDANVGRRPVADVLAELDTLNDRISDALEALPRRGRGVRLDA